MVSDNEESNGSQHSTLKPKEKKKKKLVVSRKEFLSLQSKVDQILVVVTTNQSQNLEITTPQSLAERVERLETKERLAIERFTLKIEMGIWALDNNRIVDQKQFLATAENHIKEVIAFKNELKTTLDNQVVHSKQLVKETYNAYESTIMVLQSTINSLRRSLSVNSHADEILKLTKEIHQPLFKKELPNNQQL